MQASVGANNEQKFSFGFIPSPDTELINQGLS